MREGKILPRDVHMERRHEYLHRGFKLQLLFGGFCSQAAIEFPPANFGYTNVYEGDTPGAGAALLAGCNVSPGSISWLQEQVAGFEPFTNSSPSDLGVLFASN